MHTPLVLWLLLVSLLCVSPILSKPSHPAHPRSAARHFHRRAHHRSFDNPFIAKRQVRADDIRFGTTKKKRDCPGPLVSGICNCPSPEQFCNNNCVDTTSDPANCGACNSDCTTGYAEGSECVGGTCQCPDDDQVCGGLCVNLQTDPDNCGSCSYSCFSQAGNNVQCIAGGCTCAAPLPDMCEPGGCFDLQSDPEHCGSCFNACGPNTMCSAGACQCTTKSHVLCPDGAGCVDVTNDPANCGGCGLVCGGAEVCVTGLCTPV